MTETPREQILTEAAGLITGDRNKTYGSPTENFSNTAALWSVQIGHKLTEPLTAADVAQLMVQLKMARMIAQPKRDNYVDAAGYLACGWECEEAIAEPEADSEYRPGVRYWHDTDEWFYRWDGTTMTLGSAHGERFKSSFEGPEDPDFNHYKFREVFESSVPEGAR